MARDQNPVILVGRSGYNIAVVEPRDEFPNNFVGDLVPTDRGWVVHLLPRRPRLRRPRLVGQLGVVYLQ
jgi:hypothetical protein